MKNNLNALIKITLSVLLITFGEKYFYIGLDKVGINIFDLNYLTKSLIIICFYILVFIVIYFLYRDDLSSDFRRFKRNLFPNILMTIVFFIVITLLIAVTNYLGDALANSFKVNYSGLNNPNIFNEPVDTKLIFNFLKNILIIPIIKCIIYVLGVSKIIASKNKGIIVSGLIGATFAIVSANNSFIYMLINALPYFILYVSLAYLYRKNNNNIWYSIVTFIFFSLFANILLEKLFGG